MAKVSLRAYNREIETMIDRGQLDEAIAHCQHILKTFPKHLETYRLLGKAYLEHKRYKDAVDIFSRVLAVEPNDFVANVGMSIIRDEEDKLDDAIWHMERAFEVQSANAAIQGELQRLYGRREGVQPPRIRMTRGALAHMYVQGELYPQALSEIKSVLSDDAGRTDMQVLMARAYFRSGQKNDAADTASAVLRRYPYCLDANRILVEILGMDRPENSQLYRQRVIELDPYAAQVSGSIFQANEVGDAAITLEHLEWSGQPSGTMQSDWESPRAVSLESGRGPEAQPDWLKGGGFADSTPPQATPKVVPPAPAVPASFDLPTQQPPVASQPAQPTPEADIPDFLREAGWGQSTGTFDESNSSFADEPIASASESEALPIAQGDMPDWLKAMAPPQVTQPEPTQAQPAEEEELPDWINKIGTGALSTAAIASSSDEFDWLNGDNQPAATPPAATEQPDWMNQLDQPAAQSAPTDQPDWMKGFGDEAASTPPVTEQPDWMNQLDQPAAQSASTDQPDWMKGFGDEPASTPTATEQPDWTSQFDQPAAQSAPADQPDWMKGFGDEPASTPTLPADDQPDWMKQLTTPSTESASTASSMPDEFDFLNELTEPTSQPSEPSTSDAGNLGKSQSEIDDSLAWLENLAAKQGATEGLLIKPEDRTDKEPDWVSQAKSAPQQPPLQQPAANAIEDLGKSQSEIDDSLAWLENLAAKQGATEGLLVKPEDRIEKEPDWVSQAKSTPQQPPMQQPSANAADLSKSQSEIDDSLAWLENLAAKQGATEGLLVKPEDRKDKEPDWIAKIKATTQPPAPEPSAPEPQQPAANVADFGKSQSDIDDSLAWLENLAAKQGATEGLLIKPEDRMEKEPDWVQQVKGIPQPPAANVEYLGKSQSDIDDSLAWLENLAAKQGATEGLLIKPEDRMEKEPDWVQQVKKSTGELKSEPQTQQPEIQPAANVEELGKSQSDIDDSLAWLENLAAKQGATEGLLIKPEDRMEKEPDWVQQVKKSTGELKSQPQAQQPEAQPAANVEDLGKSQSDIDDSLAWLENLAAKQGATEGLLIKPEDRMEKEPDWVQQVKNAPPEQPAPSVEQESISEDDTSAWLRSLDEEDAKPEPVPADDTAMWLKSLDEPEPAPVIPQADDMPAWMRGIEDDIAPVAESAIPEKAADDSDWMSAIEEHGDAPISVPEDDENIPSWLKGTDKESKISASLPQDDLPAWMRDETGEVVAEPTKIEPTRPTDWHPIEEKQPEPPAPQPVREQPKPAPVQETPKPAPVKKAPPKPAEVKPATPPEPYREPVTRSRGTGMLTMPMSVDAILGSARSELSRSNIPGALETYEKLIKKGRFLDEVIFDLREALYRYPVEVSIWQSLGDAYMRANRLQDALDAYTKAEELLR